MKKEQNSKLNENRIETLNCEPLEAGHDDIRSRVRDRYAGIVRKSAGPSTRPSASGCCGGNDEASPGTDCGCCSSPLGNPKASASLGYSDDDMGSVPDGANLGLGCGNPQTIAGLRPGETVLDLGSGAGFDCFLAARQVGPEGRVIGVDMTPDMVSQARGNARDGDYGNVDFRLGEIEHLPVADCSIDAIISNCVINLSPDKKQVFRDAFRVLRPGGRIAVSDVVAIAPLPKQVREDLDAHCGCVAGAALVSDIETMLSDLGYEDVSIEVKPESAAFIKGWFPGSGAENFVRSASIKARKRQD